MRGPWKAWFLVPLVAAAWTGCTRDDTGSALSGGLSLSGGDAPNDSTGDPGSDDSTGATSEGSSDTTGDDGGANGGGPRFDVMPGDSGGGADDGNGSDMGCKKVDFLFVIDNSNSMEEEQQRLIAAFPGFINSIETTLSEAQDYHVMVVDTDAFDFGSAIACDDEVNKTGCNCTHLDECCVPWCTLGAPVYGLPNPPPSCAGQPCSTWELKDACAKTLGAGRAEDQLYATCGFQAGRFLTSADADLEQKFSCAARVGVVGDADERVFDAMKEALDAQSAPGACNAGFLRDDAILVVTFITDESEKVSTGTAQQWHDEIVALKNGDPDAVVMVGVGGHANDCIGTAQNAPKLYEFANLFSRSLWGSVCQSSYDTLFDAAVSTIDTACDEFVPPAG